MTLALLTVTVAQILDLGTFVRMVAVRGAGAEANPLVSGLIDGLGIPFVAVAKVAMLSLVVAVLVVLAGTVDRPGHRRLVATVASIAVVAGLVGGWTNALALTGIRL
jgi:hypothetical protein